MVSGVVSQVEPLGRPTLEDVESAGAEEPRDGLESGGTFSICLRVMERGRNALQYVLTLYPLEEPRASFPRSRAKTCSERALQSTYIDEVCPPGPLEAPLVDKEKPAVEEEQRKSDAGECRCRQHQGDPDMLECIGEVTRVVWILSVDAPGVETEAVTRRRQGMAYHGIDEDSGECHENVLEEEIAEVEAEALMSIPIVIVCRNPPVNDDVVHDEQNNQTHIELRPAVLVVFFLLTWHERRSHVLLQVPR